MVCTIPDVISIVIEIFCLFIVAWVSIISIKQITALKDLPKALKYLYYICVITSLITILFLLISEIIWCVYPHIIAQFTWLIASFSYAMLLLGLLGTLLARLHYSFNDSMYKLSRTNKILFITLFTIIIISAILQNILFMIVQIGIRSSGPIIMNMLMLFVFIESTFYVFTSIYAVALFALNLYKLITLRQLTMRSVLDENSIKLNRHQTKLISHASRYVALLSLAIFTAIIITIFISLVFALGIRGSFRKIMYILICIDASTNIICLYLQYKFAKKYYDKYCQCLEAFWKYILTVNATKSMVQQHQNSVTTQEIQAMQNNDAP